MKKKFSLILAIGFPLTSFLNAGISILELKDTYNILKDEFKHLSPIHGAVWWETLIKNYFTYGDYLNPRYESVDKNVKIVWDKDPMMQLLHLLFHDAGGSIGPISDATPHISAQLKFETFGKILGTIERHRNSSSKSKLEKGVISGGKQEKDPTLHEDLLTIIKDEQNLALSGRYKIPKAKKRQETIAEHAQKLVDAIEQALTLDGTTLSYEKKYEPFTACMLMLSALYRKAETKNDIYQYFKGLTEGLEQDPTQNGIEALDQSWLNLQFNPQGININILLPIAIPLSQTIKETASSHSASIASSKGPNLTTTESFYEILASALSKPKTSTPPNVNFSSTQFASKNFPDCQETALRNIVNIIFYDPYNQRFQIPSFLNPTKDVQSFYAANHDSNFAEKKIVHQQWSDILQNQSWVAYRSYIYNKKDDQLPDAFSGFINIQNPDGTYATTLEDLSKLFQSAISEVYQTKHAAFPILQIGSNKYLVNPDPKHIQLFEVKASIKNTIVLLDLLLGLNIFAPSELFQEFSRSDFNSYYFRELSNRLGWNITESAEFSSLDIEIPDHTAKLNISTAFNQDLTLSIKINHHATCTYKQETDDAFNAQKIPYFMRILEERLLLFGSEPAPRLALLLNNLLLLLNPLNSSQNFTHALNLLRSSPESQDKTSFQQYLIFLQYLPKELLADVAEKIMPPAPSTIEQQLILKLLISAYKDIDDEATVDQNEQALRLLVNYYKKYSDKIAETFINLIISKSMIENNLNSFFNLRTLLQNDYNHARIAAQAKIVEWIYYTNVMDIKEQELWNVRGLKLLLILTETNKDLALAIVSQLEDIPHIIKSTRLPIRKLITKIKELTATPAQGASLSQSLD